jgi:hypothetical protein
MTTTSEELKVEQLSDPARDALGGEDVIFVLIHRKSDGHTLLVPSNLYGTLQKAEFAGPPRSSVLAATSFSRCRCEADGRCWCDCAGVRVNIGPCPCP